MGSTAARAYPYPEGSDTPVVHQDMRAGFEAVDADVDELTTVTRTTWTLPGDAANVATLAPLTLVREPNGRVTVEGAFRYTTGQGATATRSLPTIPVDFRAATARGKFEQPIVFAHDAVTLAARCEFDPQTGAVLMSRADGANISWTSNTWISLHGLTWMTD